MKFARCGVAALVLVLAACSGSSKTIGTTGSAASASSSNTAGTATVAWVAPTETVEGAPLHDLAGFKVYYGLNPTQLDQVVLINDPAVTSTEIENLTPGTWYFAATAIASDGLESDLSNVGSKTIS